MHPNSNSSTIALVTVAAEVGIGADELAQRFGDAVIVDAAGVRCISAERAREFITTHRALRQAEAERRRRRRAELAARPNPVRERLAARKRAEEQLGQIGSPGEPLDPREALATMQMLDGATDRRLAASARRRDEQTTGQLVYRRYGEMEE